MTLRDNALVKKYINIDAKGSGSSKMGILVGSFAAFAGILYGYDTGIISGVLGMDYVTELFPADKKAFTSSEKSLIVSILSVGTFFGALLAPICSDRFGRKWTIIFSSLLIFNVGVVLQTIATSIPLLCAGRAVAGFGLGVISSNVPLYQSETLPKWIRGAIVSCYQWAITIGLFLASVVNNGTKHRNDSGSYRIPIAIQILWALILGIGLFFLPESPRFYIIKDKFDDAKKSLSVLRGLPVDHPELIAEFDEIKANYDYERSVTQSGWLAVFSTKNKQLKRLVTGVGLQAFQQLTGVNFIFYYGTTFFQSSGISNEFLISLATNIVNVGSTIPGIFLIEIIGRRKLLLGGAVVMSISQFVIGITGVATTSDSANKVLVAFSCIFISAFAASWGPACWAIVGEIFPLTTRGKSIAISASSNWLWNWAIAYATPYLVDSGPGNANLGLKVFFLWGGCNFLCFFFTYFMVYETKGLSLEQVDELYENVTNAWQSPKYVPSQLRFKDTVEKPETENIDDVMMKTDQSVEESV